MCSALCACGGSDFVVEVLSVRRVPTEVDTLKLTLTGVSPSDVLRGVTVSLTNPFPVRVLFEPGDQTPDHLRITVESSHAGVVVTTVTRDVQRSDAGSDIQVRLD